jgi:FtsH-binding integral membrane protein
MNGGKHFYLEKSAFIQNDSFLKLLNEKKYFLYMVFLNLIFQLGITYYVFIKTNNPNKKIYFTLIILSFLIIILLAFVPMYSWLKLLLFTIFSYSTGYILSMCKTQINGLNKNIVQSAIISTIGIFVSMILFGFGLILFGINLGLKFAVLLLFLLMICIILLVVNIFMKNNSIFIKGVATFSLSIFSLFIIYDTNHILQRNYFGDFITASIDYYLDIINVFDDFLLLYTGNY